MNKIDEALQGGDHYFGLSEADKGDPNFLFYHYEFRGENCYLKHKQNYFKKLKLFLASKVSGASYKASYETLFHICISFV